MNNRQNGRRRGRGGQQTRNGQPGSQDRGNRIDNRARGNAAQLLEKYKSLARDAQTAGDRVNTEYYLQFADHYFRVLAESRSRFDEQRPQQARTDYRDEFGQDGDDEQDGQRFDGDTQGAGWDSDDERPHQDERPRQQEARQHEPRQQEERPRQQPAPRRFEQQPAAESADYAAGGEAQPRNERRPRRDRNIAASGEGQRNGRAANGNGTNGNGSGYAPRDEVEVSERIEVDRLPAGFATTPAPVADGGEVGEIAEAPRPRRPRAPRKPKGETIIVDA